LPDANLADMELQHPDVDPKYSETNKVGKVMKIDAYANGSQGFSKDNEGNRDQQAWYMEDEHKALDENMVSLEVFLFLLDDDTVVATGAKEGQHKKWRPV